MGKSKKKWHNKRGDIVLKPIPLEEQITLESEAKPSSRLKHLKVDNDNKYIDGTLGQNIVQQSLAQLQELNEEDFPSLQSTLKRKRDTDVDVSLVKHGPKKTFENKEKSANYHEDWDTESVNEFEDAVPINVEKTVKDFEDLLDLDEDDLAVLDHFKKQRSSNQARLANFFRDKITEKQTEIQSVVDNSSLKEDALSKETIAQCLEIGEVLHKYRSGPLPKIIKSFPLMSCWEELLFHTSPEKWSAAAMYQITRLFISNLQAHMAQQFCSLVLLPRIRDDISYYKRLNFHLYQALSKAMFKPAAFFKGIIFPLCTNENCTLREAIIIGSLLEKAHIPLAHSAAAILKISSMDYRGPNFIFLRVLYEKKYSLPYKVIEQSVENFMRSKVTSEKLPVLWHQALLRFVQIYKNDLTEEQKKDIFKLTLHQGHYKVTPQIRRELEDTSNVERMDEN